MLEHILVHPALLSEGLWITKLNMLPVWMSFIMLPHEDRIKSNATYPQSLIYRGNSFHPFTPSKSIFLELVIFFIFSLTIQYTSNL